MMLKLPCCSVPKVIVMLENGLRLVPEARFALYWVSWVKGKSGELFNRKVFKVGLMLSCPLSLARLRNTSTRAATAITHTTQNTGESKGFKLKCEICTK